MSKMLFFAQNRRMGPPPQFSVQPTSLSFGFNASSKRLTINSNYPWSYVSGETSWCTIDTKSGDGEGADTVNVSVTKNTSTSKTRSATLLFRNEKGLEARVSVSQAVHESYTLSVSPSSVTLQKDSGSQATITISANQGWTISGVPSWASVSKNSGSGSDTVTITASSENTSTDERSAVITVTGNTSGSDTVTIRQSATPIVWSVSPQSISLEADDTSEHTITVTSNTSWTISDYPEWVEVSKTSGSGSDTVTVNATSEYMGDSQRSGTITFRNTHGQTKTVSISQNAMSIIWDVNPKSLSLEATDTSDHAITVSSNLSWTISSYPDWMEVSKSSGTGNDTVNVKAKEEYTGDSQRSGEIVFKNAKDSTITVSVTQSAATITYSDVTVHMSYEEDINAAGSNSVTPVITYSQTWGYNGSTTGGGTITTGGSLTFEKTSGNGTVDTSNGKVSASSKQDNVSGRTEAATAKVTVSLNGKTGTANATCYQGENKVESSTYEYGEVILSYSDSITIEADDVGQSDIRVDMTQDKTPITVYTSGYELREQTDTIDLSRYGEGLNSVASSQSWLSVQQTNVSQITYEYTTNTSTESRSSVITFGVNGLEGSGKSASGSISVTQKGVENYLNVSPQTLSFEANGGIKEITIDTNESWTIS